MQSARCQNPGTRAALPASKTPWHHPECLCLCELHATLLKPPPCTGVPQRVQWMHAMPHCESQLIMTAISPSSRSRRHAISPMPKPWHTRRAASFKDAMAPSRVPLPVRAPRNAVETSALHGSPTEGTMDARNATLRIAAPSARSGDASKQARTHAAAEAPYHCKSCRAAQLRRRVGLLVRAILRRLARARDGLALVGRPPRGVLIAAALGARALPGRSSAVRHAHSASPGAAVRAAAPRAAADPREGASKAALCRRSGRACVLATCSWILRNTK